MGIDVIYQGKPAATGRIGTDSAAQRNTDCTAVETGRISWRRGQFQQVVRCTVAFDYKTRKWSAYTGGFPALRAQHYATAGSAGHKQTFPQCLTLWLQYFGGTVYIDA